VRTLTRHELTAALAARQFLIERVPLAPAEAIRRLTPLQGQDSPAPYVALAARLDGFTREALEQAITAREVVKTTIMRLTLHLVAADDYPAYHQLARQARLRAAPDAPEIEAELRPWLAQPRTNAEIRERLNADSGDWVSISLVRTLLPLIQLPPAGHHGDRTRAKFVIDPRPLPHPDEAAAQIVSRYLRAFGPASMKDIAAWAGVAQRDIEAGVERLPTLSFIDEKDNRLFDLPDQPLPPATTKLPPRFLARWDQPLLAFADRDRIIPPQLLPLRLTLSGAQTLTVDGRVAASWKLQRSTRVTRVTIEPHTDIRKSAHAQIRAEAKRLGASEVAGL